MAILKIVVTHFQTHPHLCNMASSCFPETTLWVKSFEVPMDRWIRIIRFFFLWFTILSKPKRSFLVVNHFEAYQKIPKSWRIPTFYWISRNRSTPFFQRYHQISGLCPAAGFLHDQRDLLQLRFLLTSDTSMSWGHEFPEENKIKWLVGGKTTPLKNMKVSWDCSKPPTRWAEALESTNSRLEDDYLQVPAITYHHLPTGFHQTII